MDIIGWLNPYRWLLLAALCGSMVLGYFAWETHQRGIGDARTTVKYEAILTKQKADAIVALDAEKAKVASLEQDLNKFHFEMELTNVANLKTVAGLKNRIAGLTDSHGRLRDPDAAARCSSGGAPPQAAPSTGDSAGNGAEAGGLLSVPLSQLLISSDDEADTINIAYIACRADAIEIRDKMQ